MKGLELSHLYFEECGLPLFCREFPEVMPKLAFGLVGSGSEVLGYDDEISSDHDFEPGFCVFLPDESEIDRKTAFRLERAYSSLPKEFKGFKRANLSPVGGNRHGILRTSDFYTEKIGAPDGNLSVSAWLSLQDYSLLEATNGCVFLDNFGDFSRIRNQLSYYPDDIRLKKLVGELWMMAQAGTYNFNRILAHHEQAAAQLSVMKYTEACLHVLFLLNKKYMPYYKWSFRAASELPNLSSLSESLEFLITTENSPENAHLKSEVMESINALIVSELITQQLTDKDTDDLEAQAYAINSQITDEYIRNLHLLAAL